MSSVLDLVHQLQSQLDSSKLPLAQLTSDSFDLDSFLYHCLSATKSTPAQVMKSLESELTAYLHESQAKVDSLIHQDFENLLRIPKGLKEFDGRIKSLHDRLTDVLTGIGSSMARLESNKETAAECVTEIEKLTEEERKLEAKIAILGGLDRVTGLITEAEQGQIKDKWAVFERIARLTAANLANITHSPELLTEVKANAEQVYTLLDTAFRGVLTIDPIPVRPFHCLFRCFSILKRLEKGKNQSAEALFREIVAGPIVKEAMEMSLSLKSAKADSLLSLSVFYKKIGREMSVGRLQLVSTAKEWQGGSTAVMSVWKEVQDILTSTKSIFTPSFAFEFRINFNETISFISSLRDLLTEGERWKLSCEGALKTFVDRWNLSAYFVIRQNEVIKVLQGKLTASGDLKRLILDPEKPSTTFIKAIDLLWSSDYYIPFIAPRFLRLHFQLLSRYVTLIQQSHNKTEGVTAGLLKELILDAKALDRYLKTKLEGLKIPLGKEVTLESEKLIAQITQPCVSSYVQLVLQQCGSNLQALRSIPGIYRMTNRPKPTAPSPFTDSFLRPLHDSSKVIDDPHVLTRMAETVAESFREVLAEVLEAINKSEQLFSKLKDTDESAQTDAEKMRVQLRLDAVYFVNSFSQWGLPATHPSLLPILQLVSISP